jgi:hypothetical protein
MEAVYSSEILVQTFTSQCSNSKNGHHLNHVHIHGGRILELALEGNQCVIVPQFGEIF